MKTWGDVALSVPVAVLVAGVFASSAHASPVVVKPPEAQPARVKMGSYGPAVATLQKRLNKLKFNAPGDGFFDDRTRAALWAFQKVNALPMRSTAERRTWRALERPRKVRKLVRHAKRNRVEISLRKQVMYIYRKGRLALVTHISTGARKRYCHHGHCGNAITPRGNFRVYKKIRRWRVGPLGAMYRPSYFHGGTAMHGSSSVPKRPASHGCVRIPMHNAKLVQRLVRKGTPVHVR